MKRLSEIFDFPTILLLGFITLKFIIQYHLIHPIYDLHRDEYLHLDQGHHLAWGYTSVPPVTSWVSYIIFLLGGSVFWVKFFPALFGSLTLVTVWYAVKELKGGTFALILASTAFVFSIILRINTLYQPNSLDILCWTLVYYTLIKYINTHSSKWLIRGALIFALGFLNKYNIGFLAIGMLPAILLTPHRQIFGRRTFYISAALALLIILPNLVWQLRNDLPFMLHMKELVATQLVNVDRKDFLFQQVLFFLSAIFVLVAALLSFLLYTPFSRYRLFFYAYWFTLAVFLYLHAKGYYALGLYPILLAFGSVYLESIMESGWRHYLRPVLIIVIIGGFLPFVKVAFPILSPEEIHRNAQAFKDLHLLRWEDGKEHAIPQDFADMLGWRELARKVDSAYDLCGNKDSTMVFCDNYGEAGAINYYSKHKNIGAVSFNADYLGWIDVDKPVKYIIAVKHAQDDDVDLGKVKDIFQTITFIDSVRDPYAIESGTRVYLVRDARIDLHRWFSDRVAKEKDLRIDRDE